jgi:hypothetical protein
VCINSATFDRDLRLNVSARSQVAPIRVTFSHASERNAVLFASILTRGRLTVAVETSASRSFLQIVASNLLRTCKKFVRLIGEMGTPKVIYERTRR